MGHWYTKNGQALHEVKKASGDGMRATTLRDAKKLNLLPSVTTILQSIAKPALISWKVQQGIISALTLPKEDSESLEDFAKRVERDSIEQVKDAGDLGTRVHHALEDYIENKVMPSDPELLPFVKAFQNFAKEYKVETIWCERLLVSSDYAGTADFLCNIKGVGTVLIDFKTCNFKKLKKGLTPVYWDDWIYQLSAYANIVGEDTLIANLALAKNSDDDSNGVDWGFKVYDLDDQKRALDAFKYIKEFWKLSKKYNPELAA